MKDSLQPGIARVDEHVVTKELSPPHLPMVVLATPSMIHLMEMASHLLAADHLDDSETTVGTHVCVSHLAAARDGQRVTVRSELETRDGRRLRFRVTAHGDEVLVGEGTHDRVVVDVSRFG